jgi:hypothetical protein
MSTKDYGLSHLTSINKLESPEYAIEWVREIKDHLAMAGYGDLLTRNKVQPSLRDGSTNLDQETLNAQDEIWKSRQEKAVAAIKNRLGYNCRKMVEKSVKDNETVDNVITSAWNHFRPKGSAHFQQLDQKYHDLCLENCTSIMDFANELQKARTALLELDESCAIGHPQFINKFLTGLGPTYSVFLTSFCQNYNILPERDSNGVIIRQPVSFTETVMKAEQEEQAMKQRESQQTALVARNNTRTRDKSRTDSKEKPPCTTCNRTGHDADGCWKTHPHLKREFYTKRNKRQRTDDQDQPERSHTTMVATDKIFEQGMGFMAFNDTTLSAGLSETAQTLQKIHILDSGASSHTFCQPTKFSHLKPYYGNPINGIADTKVMPKGIGTYKINTQASGVVVLRQSLLIPDACVNLVSVSALESEGASITFQHGKAIITQKGHTIMTAARKNGIYIIDEKEQEIKTALASFEIQDPNLRIWHDRLGHLGERNIKKLQEQSTGLQPMIPGPKCDGCSLGKMKEAPHTHNIKKGTRPFESLHADIAGPFPTKGVDGYRYWALFIDDYTMMSWIFPLKEKSEFEGVFVKLLQSEETFTRRLRFLRLDRGGENVSHSLQQRCENLGIEIIYTATDQHQQNGLAEVGNRIILEKLSPVMISSGLPLKWWPFVLRTCNYIRNLSPVAGKDVTPWEAWTGEKPDLRHLRVIGSKGYALIPPAKRKKRRWKKRQDHADYWDIKDHETTSYWETMTKSLSQTM